MWEPTLYQTGFSILEQAIGPARLLSFLWLWPTPNALEEDSNPL